jgi:hypothetical protein
MFDVKVTETITSNLTTMAHARIKDRAVKAKVAAEGALFIPLSISSAGGLGCGFKRVFDMLVKHADEYRSIPPGALRTYWLRRVSVSLQNGVTNCFYKHVGRANTPSFYDDCLGHVGSVSVSNRRRGLG